MFPDVISRAEQFIQGRIVGTRLGSIKPQWQHSIEVKNLLHEHGYSEEVILAGLLHDAIEDAEATREELHALGCTSRTLELIQLATHDATIPHKDFRWTKMMLKLAEANDAEAWAIKIADLLSNLQDCETMPSDRARLMIEVKAGLMLALAAPRMSDSLLYQKLHTLRQNKLYATP